MEVEVTYQNPFAASQRLTTYIDVMDHSLAQDWVTALKKLLANGNKLEKGFCFHGWPNTPRDIEFLCEELNRHVQIINESDLDYVIIEDWFCEDSVRFGPEYPTKHREGYLGLTKKDAIMNRLHAHFEILQGTVENPSHFYDLATEEVRKSISQLNLLCHELESQILTQYKKKTAPEWIRPSQVISFVGAPRYELLEGHLQYYSENGFIREFGTIYAHWAQIGKTWYEVFRDENGPELSDLVCEAVTNLQYYSGEFDIEWGRTINYDHKWFSKDMAEFWQWCEQHGIPKDYVHGYAPIGRVDLMRSFGTEEPEKIWEIMGSHLDIYRISCDGVSNTYPVSWIYEEQT